MKQTNNNTNDSPKWSYINNYLWPMATTSQTQRQFFYSSIDCHKAFLFFLTDRL